MLPVMSFLGNSCPVASAIKCNVSFWRDIATHAACNKTRVEYAYAHFDEVVSRKESNMSVVCQ